MIVRFDIPLVRQSIQRQRRDPLASLSFGTIVEEAKPVTSIYVPVMDRMGFEFAHPDDYMGIFKANNSVTKGRTVEHNFDGIIYRTTDGTDALKRLKYELVVSNGVTEQNGDIERGKILFKLSEAEPMS